MYYLDQSIKLNKGSEKDGSLAGAFHLRGVFLEKLDRKQDAVGAYEQALKIQPSLDIPDDVRQRNGMPLNNKVPQPSITASPETVDRPSTSPSLANPQGVQTPISISAPEKASPTPGLFPIDEKTGVVSSVDGSANLRSSASAEDRSNFITTIPNGTSVIILEEQRNDLDETWYRVQVEGQTGWMSKSRIIDN